MLIPSFKEAINLTKTENHLYRKTELNISKDFILHTFDYITGSDKKNITGLGLEMRGLSFLENLNDGTIKRYLSLRKFYNLNEREDTMIDNLKEKRITTITKKEDGSLMSFLSLGNNVVIPKTRNGMNSVSTQLSTEWVKRNNMSSAISKMIDNGYFPFFEITGIENIIVILYPETKLTLLQVRKDDGKYLNKKEVIELCNKVGFPLEFLVEEIKDETLSTLHELSKTVKNIEGWVVMFNETEMVKIKTQWYLDEKVKLYGDNFKWKDLLVAILDDKIDEDDMIDLPSYKVLFIKSMKSKITFLFDNYVENFMKDFAEVKKNSFLNNDDSKALRVAMKLLSIDKVLLKELAKKEFLKSYNKESDARKLFMKTKD